MDAMDENDKFQRIFGCSDRMFTGEQNVEITDSVISWWNRRRFDVKHMPSRWQLMCQRRRAGRCPRPSPLLLAALWLVSWFRHSPITGGVANALAFNRMWEILHWRHFTTCKHPKHHSQNIIDLRHKKYINKKKENF